MNENLYQASYKALTDKGVPPKHAERASEVVATDQVGTPRTPDQQKVVTDAWHWLTAKQREEQS